MMRWQNGFLSVLAGVLCFGSVVLAGPQVLEVSPRYLEFTGYEGGVNPAAQAVSIWNSGNGPMAWTVTEDCNWITVEPNSGSSSGEVDDANVVVDINGLAEGTYNCQLTVTGSGAPNSPQVVDVNLVVFQPMTIELSATYFEFTAYEGGTNPDDQILGISNSGAGTLNWEITEGCGWLTVEPNDGNSTGEWDDVNLSVDITGLAGGIYNCQLTVSDAYAANSPQIVDVNLVVIGPVIGLSATQVEFTAYEGGANPDDQIVSISNSGGGTLNWDITEACAWLTVAPDSGSSTGEADDVNLSVDITGLAGGSYNCQLTVSDTNASNSPQFVDVELVVGGLVSWWRFDEGGGGAAYDSAGGNDGTIYGATWTNGQIGSALDFNGVSDYVDIGNDSSLKPSLPVTIAGWVKLSDSGKIQRIISIDEQSSKYYGIWLEVQATDKVGVNFGDGTGGASQAYRRSKVGTTALSTGTWYHIVAVIRGAADMDIYINGADDGGSYSGSGGGLAYSSGNSAIGYESGARYYFDGLIDDARVYNVALTGQEILQLWRDSLGGKAYMPIPSDGQTGVDSDVILRWSSNPWASDVNGHDVYFGTNYADVNDATTASAEYMGNYDTNSWATANYDPFGLKYGAWHYWRIDEVNESDVNSPWKGNVWSFQTGNPVIEVSGTQYEFIGFVGSSNPNDQILNVSNSGVGTLKWEISQSCSWLTPEPNSGSSTGEVDDVNLSVDITGLASGTYDCSLTVADANATNSPQTVTIRLYVRIDDGELQVPLEYPTIQGAIDDANEGEAVVVWAGTYTGADNKNLDFGGKAITVRSIDPEDPCVVVATVIECENSGRGFYFQSGEGLNSILSGFTIKDGRVGASSGGGIHCSGSSPTIENCIIRDNTAIGPSGSVHDAYGGGIYCSGCSPTIRNCIISSNTVRGRAGFYGYGIHGGDGFGGGICCVSSSSPIIINCTIGNNLAKGGQGEDSPLIHELAGDGGDGYGGGVHSDSSSHPIITNCVIAGNTASGGRGGYGMGTSGGDGGSGYGGGVYCSATLTIDNTTVIANFVVGGAEGLPGGSAGSAICGGVYGASTVSNSIIWGNDANQIEGSATVTYSDIEGGYTGPNNIAADPCFVSGPEGDYYLSQIAAGQAVDSPCVDAGSDTAANLGMDIFGTRTDEIVDTAVVDMGYHYPVAISADACEDWHVDFFDYAVLASDWLECDLNGLAGDITRDTCVDGDDLRYFVECWLDCYVSGASAPLPTNGQSFADPNGILVWSAGEGAVCHDVYLGTGANAVADADYLSPEFMVTDSNTSFDPCTLDFNTTYYWRVDEVGPRCTTGGDVWSFTTWAEPNVDLGVVSWWEFDEGTGSVAYDSVGGNDGTIYGATWTTGQVGSYALDFNGISDYVELGSNASLKPSLPVSLGGWIKLSDSGKIQRAISIDEQSPTYYGMWLQVDAADKLHVGFGDGKGGESQSYRRSKVGTAVLGTGTWYHVAAVIRGATDMEVYVNGVDDGGSYSGSGGSLAYSSGNSAIGYENGARYYFDGAIDDVRVYDRALSASEVWQLYQSGL